MNKSVQARYRWLVSQLRWHRVRAEFYASPLIQTPGYRDAERWHRSQAKHYERQIWKLWKLKP